MKKRGILALLCAAMLLFACGCEQAMNEGFYLYKSSPLGFRMEYPESWQKQVDLDKKIAAFVTPTEGMGDTYRENVTVTQEARGERSFDDFFEEYYNSLPSTMVSFVEESREQVLLDNKEAYEIVFTCLAEREDEKGKKQKDTMRVRQYIVDVEEQVYFVTFMGTPDSFEYFTPFVNTMLETFSFNV